MAPSTADNNSGDQVQNPWDELDRLVDQLRSMANLLQYVQLSWAGTCMLTPYMQTMDDLLVRVSEIHQLLHKKCVTSVSPPNKTGIPPTKE